jgi:poly-gamma-glutamate capsule biosynthesis protein CapA/YwtB (metallophosphatase superfamily)
MPKNLRFPLFIVMILSLAILWRMVPQWLHRAPGPVTLRISGTNLTIAATGDTALFRPIPSPQTDPGFRDAIAIVQRSSLGLTNLEESLLDPSGPPEHIPAGTFLWPYGSTEQAQDLRKAGFSVISLANNHALDYGVSGLEETSQVLDRAGLLHAGSGQNLEQARTPAYLGATAPNQVAVISIAVSASSESRATYSHGEIVGRPGVSALKYSPDVTLDPATFAILEKSNAADKDKSQSDAGQFMISGTLVKRGAQTSVEFVPDARDANDLFSRIKAARSKGDVVVVMLHSHEPSNWSQAPADFVERFAHKLIDAGAQLVVGQGPHQLRGIEVYKGNAILYSLGNFFFDYSSVDPRSADVYDAGADLYRLALGAFGESETLAPPHFDEGVWWESVIAVASFDRGALKSLELHPIDLGVDLPLSQRGTPRLATGSRADAILQRLSSLSEAMGTRVRLRKGIGFVDLTAEPK